MKMNFTMFSLFSVFLVSFLQIADCQTCGSQNRGKCATLSCPSTNCTKRLCRPTQEIRKEHDMTAAITVPILVLLLLVIVVFVIRKYARSYFRSSHRQDRGSLKSENPSVTNNYSFGRRQSPSVPGPPKTMPSFPPFPTDDNEYENGYEYELEYQYWDIGNPRGKDNPIKVTAEDDYESPNPPLGKPNFPPPQVPDSPT